MKKINAGIFLIASLFLVAFDIYKAGHTSFTHDESVTYLRYASMGFLNIISYKSPMLNNHILNTLFVKLFAFVFGSSELSLRFPNILSHLVYLFFTYKIFDRYCTKLFIPFFILANFNPFLLDFFSLARGYGMAIGLMSVSVYYYIKYLETGISRYHIISIICLCFAALANFALLNVYISFIVVHNILTYFFSTKQLGQTFWQINKVNIIATVLFGIILYEPLRSIVTFKLMNEGGVNGIWQDTVSSLVDSTAYEAAYSGPLIIFLKGFVIVFSVLFILTMSAFILKRDFDDLLQRMILFIGLVLFLIIGSTMIQHLIFNTPYLAIRFALFLCPLFMLNACLLIYYYYIKERTLLTVSAYFFAAIFLIHTVSSLNTSFYREWKYDRYTKSMLSFLEKNKSVANTARVQLGISWVYEPAINFYRETLNLSWLKEVDRNGLKPGDDFYYVNEEDEKNIPAPGKAVIFEFIDPKSTLAIQNKTAKL